LLSYLFTPYLFPINITAAFRPSQWLKCVSFQPFSSQFRQISHQQKTEELKINSSLAINFIAVVLGDIRRETLIVDEFL